MTTTHEIITDTTLRGHHTTIRPGKKGEWRFECECGAQETPIATLPGAKFLAYCHREAQLPCRCKKWSIRETKRDTGRVVVIKCGCGLDLERPAAAKAEAEAALARHRCSPFETSHQCRPGT